MPHSHLLCKSILMYAVNPGVDTIPLIKINHWDFEWQDYYFFKRLIRIPAGYKVYAEHIYDNTSANPHNPHNPPQTTYAGSDTDDEMLFDGMLFLFYQPGDELIDLQSILDNDPLLGLNGQKTVNDGLSCVIYPNPASGTINFSYSLPGSSPVSISITDLAGREIFRHFVGEMPPGKHHWRMKLDDNEGEIMASGVYFYRIETGFGILNGKVVGKN